jgi:hypothetical protein
MFTPIVDSNYMKWNLHLFGNLFVDYQAESFRHGNLAYLNRAWCRLEMLYAANIPLQIESKAYVGNRYLKFLGGLKFAAEQNRRPHILYGSKEYYTSKQLLMLPPLAKSYFHEYNPEMGFLHFPQDMQRIQHFMKQLQPYYHHCYEELIQYTGELNANGLYEGYGELHHENGEIYHGAFRNGLRHGYGILTYHNGDQYRGDFYENQRQGYGIMIYSNGNQYIGQFDSNFRNGRGILIYAINHSIYEGEFQYGYQQGQARYYLAKGYRYEGTYYQDRWQGYGTLIRGRDGTVTTGLFRRGELVEEIIPSNNNNNNGSTSTSNNSNTTTTTTTTTTVTATNNNNNNSTSSNTQSTISLFTSTKEQLENRNCRTN